MTKLYLKLAFQLVDLIVVLAAGIQGFWAIFHHEYPQAAAYFSMAAVFMLCDLWTSRNKR